MSLILAGCSYFGTDPTNADESATQPKPKISVTVSGVDDSIAENIRAHVTLSRKPCDTPRAYVKAMLNSADAEIADALAAFGYYQANYRVDTQSTESCPAVNIEVAALGPPTMLQEVDIEIRGEASTDEQFLKVVNALPLKQGAQLQHSDYEKSKQTIKSYAAERGYFDAKFSDARLEIDPAKAQARAVLTLESGIRYRIGAISVTQDPDLLSPGLIHRYYRGTTGSYYEAETVNDLNNGLLQSSYFRSVDVRPDFNQRDSDSIPLSIALVPRARHSFSAASGVSTNEGLRGRVEYLNRRLNRFGHRGVIDGRASLIAQSASAEYRIPRANPRAEWLTFQVGLRRENVDSFDTQETQASISETKLRSYGWLETRFLRFSNQDFDVGSQKDSSTFVTPGIRWLRTTVNDELFPTKGSKYSLEVRGASESFLSDTSFVRAVASAHWIRGLWSRSRIHVRSTFGSTWVDDFLKLPPSERFFTGGDTTIRGYEFQELGPEDEQGEVIGGAHLGVLSVEYEHPITERWSGASFVDAGNAFGGDGSSTGIKLGVGFGVRWRSPVGPIRADIAHPVNGNQTVRFHLRIGPDL